MDAEKREVKSETKQQPEDPLMASLKESLGQKSSGLTQKSSGHLREWRNEHVASNIVKKAYAEISDKGQYRIAIEMALIKRDVDEAIYAVGALQSALKAHQIDSETLSSFSSDAFKSFDNAKASYDREMLGFKNFEVSTSKMLVERMNKELGESMKKGSKVDPQVMRIACKKAEQMLFAATADMEKYVQHQKEVGALAKVKAHAVPISVENDADRKRDFIKTRAQELAAKTNESKPTLKAMAEKVDKELLAERLDKTEEAIKFVVKENLTDVGVKPVSLSPLPSVAKPAQKLAKQMEKEREEKKQKAREDETALKFGSLTSMPKAPEDVLEQLKAHRTSKTNTVQVPAARVMSEAEIDVMLDGLKNIKSDATNVERILKARAKQFVESSA